MYLAGHFLVARETQYENGSFSNKTKKVETYVGADAFPNKLSDIYETTQSTCLNSFGPNVCLETSQLLLCSKIRSSANFLSSMFSQN